MATKSELSGEPLEAYDESIFSCMEKAFNKSPDKVAVVSRTQQADHLSEMVQRATGRQPSRISDCCLRWTFAEYFDTAVNLATGMASYVPNADPIMVTFIPNSVEWLLLFSSSMIAKFGVAFLDKDMLQQPRRAELEARLVQLRPFAIVVADGTGAAAVDDALQGPNLLGTLPDPLKISLETTKSGTGIEADAWQPFVDLCEPRDLKILARVIDDARHDDPDRTAMVIYTSGTSGGMPKGCVRNVSTVVSYAKQQKFANSGESHHHVRIIHTANFRGIAPLVTLVSWRDGATVVLSKYPFQPSTYLDDVEQENVTELVLIPAQLYAVSEDPSVRSRRFNSVRLVGLGGDIVTSELLRICKQCFPKATFQNIHGMTEGGALFQWHYPDDVNAIPFHHGVAPVGHVAPGSRIRILSPTGEVVPRGESGDLHVQSRTIFKKYLRQQTDMPEIYTDKTGRWFKTGDTAMMNEAGDVYIIGRTKDVIKRAGVSIAPSTIESCLQAYIGTQVSRRCSHFSISKTNACRRRWSWESRTLPSVKSPSQLRKTSTAEALTRYVHMSSRCVVRTRSLVERLN